MTIHSCEVLPRLQGPPARGRAEGRARGRGAAEQGGDAHPEDRAARHGVRARGTARLPELNRSTSRHTRAVEYPTCTHIRKPHLGTSRTAPQGKQQRSGTISHRVGVQMLFEHFKTELFNRQMGTFRGVD